MQQGQTGFEKGPGQIRMKIFRRYIQKRIPRTRAGLQAPRRTGSNGGPKRRNGAAPRCRTRRLLDEVLHRPAHDVDRDRVRADHEQRERPALPALDLDHRVEAGEDQDDQAAAVERVGRGPDPLHDRVEVQPLQREAGQRERDARDDESLQLRRASRAPTSATRPHHSPSIIVASVGMKLRVDQPPPLNRNGFGAGRGSGTTCRTPTRGSSSC